jgi:hypothetical protein
MAAQAKEQSIITGAEWGSSSREEYTEAGWNDAPALAGKNPAGKTELIPYPFTSLKVRGHFREACVGTRKVESLALCKARVNMGFGGNTTYFGGRSGPALGSPEQALN